MGLELKKKVVFGFSIWRVIVVVFKADVMADAVHTTKVDHFTWQCRMSLKIISFARYQSQVRSIKRLTKYLSTAYEKE